LPAKESIKPKLESVRKKTGDEVNQTFSDPNFAADVAKQVAEPLPDEFTSSLSSDDNNKLDESLIFLNELDAKKHDKVHRKF